jgi:hypothetical protein
MSNLGLRRFLRHEFTLATVGAVLLAVAMVWLIPPYAARLVTGGVKAERIANPAHTIIGDTGDPTAQAWLVGWNGHALTHGLHGLWETNAFYPDQNGLALNDSLFGYAPAGLIGSGVTAAVLNIIFCSCWRSRWRSSAGTRCCASSAPVGWPARWPALPLPTRLGDTAKTGT